MNDFTKEELEEIQEIARHCCKQGINTIHNLTYYVKIKAQTMIDNYCEHEWEGFTIRNIRCMKCKKDIWYD